MLPPVRVHARRAGRTRCFAKTETVTRSAAINSRKRGQKKLVKRVLTSYHGSIFNLTLSDKINHNFNILQLHHMREGMSG